MPQPKDRAGRSILTAKFDGFVRNPTAMKAGIHQLAMTWAQTLCPQWSTGIQPNRRSHAEPGHSFARSIQKIQAVALEIGSFLADMYAL